MTRKSVVAANWKMHHGVEETVKFLASLKRQTLLVKDVDVVVCPPFTSLSSACVAVQDTEFKIGAQNCYFEDEGAFTGEVSAAFLKEMGCEFVILGHSERRQIFGETDEAISKKLAKALEHGLHPIFCVGETEGQREKGETFSVLSNQLSRGLMQVSEGDAKKMVLAYEPVWAIGTGRTATPAQAQEAHHFIREYLLKNFSRALSVTCRVIYGGSVKPDNIRSLMKEEDIDGALVGGASLNPETFLEIVKGCVK